MVLKNTDQIRIVQNWFSELLLKLLSSKAIRVDGFTFYNTIFIRKDKLTTKLLAHELVHVEQYHSIGFFKFIFKYLYKNIKYGYMLNPYEIEAYRKQNSQKYIGFAVAILRRYNGS